MEIVMLRRWLGTAFLVNVLLLTVDYLRAESDLLLLGIVSCLLFAALDMLPNVNDHVRRNLSRLERVLLGIASNTVSLEPN